MPSTVTILAAGLGANHGYTIEGDIIHLHADIVVYDSAAAASHQWSLQLWACDRAFGGGLIGGHKLADASIGSLTGNGSPTAVHASTHFDPPAGGGTFTLVLLLVAAPGEIHGYASYPRPESFHVPRLRGHAGYKIDGRRISLEIGAIENPREASNLSGTLSVELWALPAPYAGGHFNGAPLAAAVLGSLAGQSEWDPPPLDLVFKAPPNGTWHFCLMLREWTGTGYTTRDYANFAEPVAYTAPEPAAGETPPTKAPFTEETSTTEPSVETLTPPPKTPARRASTKKTAAIATPALSASTSPVSINKATAAELTSVKGLSKPIANAIVAARPFKTLDGLLDVKGMGPKLLSKLKPALKL